jgi:hypothetical protein
MRASRGFFAALAVSLLGSAALAALAAGPWPLFGWAAGNLLAVGNGVLAAWISRRAVGPDVTRFFLWGLGANGLRAMTLVLSIAAADRLRFPERNPLILCALFGYFVFLVREILDLHFRSAASSMPGSFEARAK